MNTHKDAFIDGMDFWNANDGLAFGDPIEGKLLLVNTEDGGATWKELPRESQPDLEEGEASFAASGTTIRCFENGRVIIATGGKVSRLLLSNDFGKSWSTIYTPILQGEATTGIFSFDFINKNEGIIVGGDYQIDSLKMDHVFYTSNGGMGWQRPVAPTNGYRECVLIVNDSIALTVGPNGMDVSYDAGKYWESLSDLKGFHTVKKSKKGDAIVLSGAAGKIATISAKALTEKQ
ncbi:MAG: oxidoreductase [Bacteroidetes bacterium]|nr:oxidoreductase [Bacteroidota bacterium]